MGEKVICDECEQPLSSKRLLDIHKKAKHFENPADSQCDLCNDQFETKPQLKKHRYEKHSESSFLKLACDRCEKTFASIHTRINHTLRKHLKEKNAPCDKCSYMGFSIDDVRYHNMNKHSDKTPYKCSLCPRVFKRVAYLKRHLKEHAGIPISQKSKYCKMCKKSQRAECKTKSCTKQGIPGDLPCSEKGCDKIFTNDSALKYHIKTIHFPNQLPCHTCDKSFKTNSDLRRHKFYMHEQKGRPISCPKCPKNWKSKDSLKRHLMSHDKKTFRCPFEGCNSTRTIEYGIRHHYRLKHDGKVLHKSTLEERLEKDKARNERIPCPICKLLIKSGNSAKYHMKVHLRNHIGNEMIPCPVIDCSKKIENTNYYGFNLPGIFAEHLIEAHSISRTSHSVSVTFVCKVCNKTEKIWNQSSRNSEFWKQGTRPANFWKQNSNMWIDFLRRHLSQMHKQASDEIKDFKIEWQKYFENGAILIETKNPKDDLDDILQHQCKLCDWQYYRKGTKISERLALAEHYCTYHFGEPLQNCVDENITLVRGKKYYFCLECKKKYNFQSKVKKVIHMGYHHGELYKYLKEDSSIDLTPFRERKEVKAKIYTCDNCETVFQRKLGLMSHVKYSCVKKGFSTLTHLTRHKMKKHSAIVPVSCEVCQKNFKHQESLEKHNRVAHLLSQAEAQTGMKLSKPNMLSELMNECENLIKDPVH